MSQPANGQARTKCVLLIDAVTWSSAYPNGSPLRDVCAWYSRWLTRLPDLALTSIGVEADVLAAIHRGTDGVILSGSPRDAWTDDPVNARLCEVLHACRDLGLPFFGVCYGHQLLARALGGVVAPHPRGLELGNTEIELAPAGRASPLFDGLPDRFQVLSSHADAVLELPPTCELLARGDFTPIQAFHWNHQLFGVQFHPETDPDTLRFIWSARREVWRERVSFDLGAALDALQPTPLAGNILRNFVTHLIP